MKNCPIYWVHLIDIRNNREIFDSVNLIQVKLSIKKYKEKILFILKGLNYEDLKFLETVSKDKIKSEFLENFFDFFSGIAKIHKDIDEINANPPVFGPSSALAHKVQVLCDKGFIQIAKDISHTIPDESTRKFSLEICEGKKKFVRKSFNFYLFTFELEYARELKETEKSDS